MKPLQGSLFARLSAALLVIMLLSGGGFFLVEQYAVRHYHEEITQRLNASIAMYVTGERQLISDGQVNRPALEQLAQQAMVINPTVEVYLLDAGGNIIADTAPPGALRNARVDLGPVRALVAGNATMPLHGTDPLSDRRKVFSAHPVMDGERLEGYLYAILGGQKYDALASSIRGSYVQKLSLGALLALLAAVFAVGLLVFGQLTRRLVRLATEVRRFTDAGFDAGMAPAPAVAEPAGADEIGQLRAAFGRMAAKIAEQFEGLKETDRLRRELISNVSHDLRTPLASMHGYVETLLLKNRELDAEERRRLLEITRRHTRRLGQLVGDLFDLSRLEAAAITPALEQFPLAELLQDVVQEFALQAEQKGVVLAVEQPPQALLVQADIGLIQRVLENLVRNALRYTPRGGRITVRLAPRPDAVAVAVSDTGCGIAESELERVFDRHYRVDQDAESGSGSAGLGLAIVRKILDLHGSRITVSSRPNEGTCFEFELPARRAA